MSRCPPCLLPSLTFFLSGAVYAMKVLRKENVVKRKQVEHTKTERRVLGYTKHPFIVGLHYAFQTLDNLCVT